MYAWRRLSDAERGALMRERRELKRPMHSPTHRVSDRSSRYHVTAACYEHRPIIGASEERLADFSNALVEAVEEWLTHERERQHPAAGAIQPPKGGTPTDARLQPATPVPAKLVYRLQPATPVPAKLVYRLQPATPVPVFSHGW